MLAPLVRRYLGVEDAPRWLAAEVERAGGDPEAAVAAMAPQLAQVLRRNLARFRPGGGSLRKAAPFLAAELVERAGMQPAFVRLAGQTVAAAARGEGLYTPVVALWARRRQAPLAAVARRHMSRVVALAMDGESEGVVASVERLETPPYYVLRAPIARLLAAAGAMRLPRDHHMERLYAHWRRFRERGLLTLAWREYAGVLADILAVGLGIYAVASGRRARRLARYVDEVYEA